MIEFLNFIALLLWAFFKLLFSLFLCGVTVIILKPTLQEASKIISECLKKVCGAWEEIKIMERSEYGD